MLRAAMKSVLPSGILDRRKVGFRVPFNEWFRGPYRDLVRDLLTSDTSEVARSLPGERIAATGGRAYLRKQNHEKILWSLANLEMFLRISSLLVWKPLRRSRIS